MKELIWNSKPVFREWLFLDDCPMCHWSHRRAWTLAGNLNLDLRKLLTLGFPYPRGWFLVGAHATALAPKWTFHSVSSNVPGALSAQRVLRDGPKNQFINTVKASVGGNTGEENRQVPKLRLSTRSSHRGWNLAGM